MFVISLFTISFKKRKIFLFRQTNAFSKTSKTTKEGIGHGERHFKHMYLFFTCICNLFCHLRLYVAMRNLSVYGDFFCLYFCQKGYIHPVQIPTKIMKTSHKVFHLIYPYKAVEMYIKNIDLFYTKKHWISYLKNTV